MKAVFIVGTDTGVGKTVITGCLARHLFEKGYSVITQKWIQTGCDSFSHSDVATHLKIMGRKATAIKEHQPYAVPYIFKPACSPHLASKIEDRRISADKIIKSFNFLSRHFDLVIIEGVGGVLVPFTDKRLVIDIVKEVDLPVVIVAGNKLGAINHTLLTIEALRARKIRIVGLVFNNLRKEDKRILKDNPRIIGALSGQEIFGTLSWEPSHKKLYKRFAPIGERIFKRL
ncbi:MAG: dethiobiotin synthase [Candidatus Omnitrophota bacterium]|nr:dethiobiotin synthase [Candidatus Omnitrophota bacterium]